MFEVPLSSRGALLRQDDHAGSGIKLPLPGSPSWTTRTCCQFEFLCSCGGQLVIIPMLLGYNIECSVENYLCEKKKKPELANNETHGLFVILECCG